MTSGGGLTLGCVALAIAGSGCSFLNERVPPSTPASPDAVRSLDPDHPRQRPCPSDGFWSPVADTVSTAAGLTWVLYANKQAKGQDYVPPSYDTQGNFSPGQPSEPGTDSGLVKAERIFGYSSMVLFGASAIYGYVVEGACYSYRKRLSGEASASAPPPQAAPALLGFPGSVLEFSFEMTPAQAGVACTNGGRVWKVEGSLAHCTAAPGSVRTSEVRLRYSLGTPSEITLVYRAPQSGLNEQFRVLDTSMRKFYGAPQLAANLPAACSASLEQCLAAGEHPVGPAWHWPKGSIEIAPIWRDEQALIELRYVRAEE